MHPISAAFIQILNATNGTSGCGFLLKSGQICTCAHVCAQALGRPGIETSADPPSDPISFVRPFISSDVSSARITSWSMDTARSVDAAPLTPDAALAGPSIELPMGYAHRSVGAPFEGYGYQVGAPFGLNARGRFGKRDRSSGD